MGHPHTTSEASHRVTVFFTSSLRLTPQFIHSGVVSFESIVLLSSPHTMPYTTTKTTVGTIFFLKKLTYL